MRFFLALLFVMTIVLPAHAVNPDEVLADPALEQRARVLSAKLRCLVCQNQSIDDSNAPLARDLRILVRERLTAGDSNEAALDYIVARYGEFVLLQPRFGAHTVVLWFSPFVLLIGGALFLFFWLKEGARRKEIARLSDEEEDALKELLERQ